jgi:hypothetical protein
MACPVMLGDTSYGINKEQILVESYNKLLLLKLIVA